LFLIWVGFSLVWFGLVWFGLVVWLGCYVFSKFQNHALFHKAQHTSVHSGKSMAETFSGDFPGNQKGNIVVKVGMVGDAQIGKTSLMVKYVEGTFDEDYVSTFFFCSYVPMFAHHHAFHIFFVVQFHSKSQFYLQKKIHTCPFRILCLCRSKPWVRAKLLGRVLCFCVLSFITIHYFSPSPFVSSFFLS
jgi:hypothetical protein